MKNQDIINLFEISEQKELVISIRTPVKLLKKDKEGNKNELQPIFKVATQKIVINKPYENAVNEQRETEEKVADFKSEGRKWGEQVNAIITKEDGTQYLSYILLENIGKPEYQYEDCSVLEKEVFQKFLPTTKPSTNQGVENVVQARTVKLVNIVATSSVV